MSVELSNEEISRYSRHLILPEVGMKGQKKLKATSVLCIGTGGLGSPISMYLAAAGIGKIGIVDFDVVDFSNLQRQIAHGTADVGRPKVESGFLHLSPLADEKDVEEGILREVLKDAFGQRRKRLLPRLEKSLPEAARRMRELGIPDDARPETVAPSDNDCPYWSFCNRSTEDAAPP